MTPWARNRDPRSRLSIASETAEITSPSVLPAALRATADVLCITATAVILGGGCSPAATPRHHQLPEGAQLVLQVGDLEFYRAFEEDVCVGTLARMEAHAKALAELLHTAPPRAQVILYDDADVVAEACSAEVSGCSYRWGAHTLASAATHEMAHIFLSAATGHVKTWPFVKEGLAERLEGRWLAYEAANFDGLANGLAASSGLDVERGQASTFFAWACDQYGIESVVEMYLATAKATDAASLGLSIARSFDLGADLLRRAEVA